LNPVGLNIASGLPLPNQSVTTYGTSDYFQSRFYSRHANEFIGKVDHQLFPWWYANFSYVHFSSTVPSTTALEGLAGKTLSTVLYRKVDAIAQNNTITLNPRTILTVGYGFNRFPNKYVDTLKDFSQATLGFPSSYVSSLQKNSFPNITMQTAATQGNNNPGFAVFSATTFAPSAKISQTAALPMEPIRLQIHSPSNCRTPGTSRLAQMWPTYCWVHQPAESLQRYRRFV
jgi:hypothetical protein